MQARWRTMFSNCIDYMVGDGTLGLLGHRSAGSPVCWVTRLLGHRSAGSLACWVSQAERHKLMSEFSLSMCINPLSTSTPKSKNQATPITKQASSGLRDYTCPLQHLFCACLENNILWPKHIRDTRCPCSVDVMETAMPFEKTNESTYFSC